MKLGVIMLGAIMAAPAALAAPLFPTGLTPVALAPSAEPQMINNPNPASFQVYGAPSAPKTIADEAVEGGRALPVSTTGKGEIWSVGVNVPVTKAVKAGDHIEIYFWARLKGDGGSASIPAQLQLAAEPYTALFGERVTLTAQWKLHKVSGTVQSNHARGALTAAFHVNSGAHEILFGAVAILNHGKTGA